jgi:HPt (histidine-containing phosphotransfer) domain-containing protein
LVLPRSHPLYALEAQGLSDLVVDIFGAFLDTTPAFLREMASALERGDLDQVVTLAHSLKGAAVQIGADAMNQVCVDVERAARAGGLDDLPLLLDRLAAHFEDARVVLEEQRRRLTGLQG